MRNEQVAPETKGVTVNLLAMVDLGPEIEGMSGCQFRTRMVTIEPGGDRPEDWNTTNWLENRGTIPAVEIPVDIVRQEWG